VSSRGIRILIGAVVIAIAFGALLWVGISHSTVYYYTVSELRAKGPAVDVRVSGQLVNGSITALGVTDVSFAIHDRDHTGEVISVTFSGVVPDSFRDQPDTEVVVQGDYLSGDTFQASTILAKCPSKYEAATSSTTATAR
jgi:cytochrome c-type biogenesis protein CcmE